MAQETFYAAYRKFDSFDNRNPKSWLCTIAANKCRDYLKNPARRIVPVDTDDFAYIADEHENVHETVERADMEDGIRRLCERLRDPYRATALAYYCAGETLTEIGLRTGENRKTVATRLYRARELLKILLREEERHENTVS